ncbi:TPA: hypothetical protein G8N70_003125 [Salmonella enterica]|uniref:Uncharacterized protein n=1 Tax=Salmonella enterica TaxID=28901 RepID=A0A744CC57_SALER|nr:hypothetical protein [Salmonella enterica]HAF4919976.1 hypothetical protein [Salmonella enterica]
MTDLWLRILVSADAGKFRESGGVPLQNMARDIVRILVGDCCHIINKRFFIWLENYFAGARYLRNKKLQNQSCSISLFYLCS